MNRRLIERLPAVFLSLAIAATAAAAAEAATAAGYFPPPDRQGGWRTPANAAEARRLAGIDLRKLDEAFDLAKANTKNGGLLVARHGWLVYEKYFGMGYRDATPNTASCGKAFTSIAIGILMAERPELFPDGFDQKVFTPRYFPPEAFPLSDPRKAEIKLGQLLSMTAGIRGNNPGFINGRPVQLDPAGPDGWLATVDEMALGKMDGKLNAITLWCAPGEGYSYATSSVHLASILLRHVTGMELQQYVEEHLAKPLGWGNFGWAYRRPETRHTPGGGGIAVRATDMLRFAHLLLRDGRWNERQLVPADYVRRCGRRSPYNPHYAHSLQFNVNEDGEVPDAPRDAFWKRGSGGHCVYVVPSLELVIWKLGGRDGQYDPRDTGMAPVPRSVVEQNGPRADWKQTVGDDAATHGVLSLSAAACRK